jgi:NAD(P)-dependent dehydrogenase (short-subunit alcohol dehydrogenase family)
MSIVMITGCSTGFGLETALAFARQGDTVYATMRNLAKSDPLMKRAEAEGLEINLLSLDVNDDKSVAAAIHHIQRVHGAIDVLVNNAGVGYEGSVETIDIDNARDLMETNFWRAVRTIRTALPAMRAKRAGVIINVTSVSGRVPGTAYNGWYGASKHALNALTEAMVMELDGFGVRVACIEPGFSPPRSCRTRPPAETWTARTHTQPIRRG